MSGSALVAALQAEETGLARAARAAEHAAIAEEAREARAEARAAIAEEARLARDERAEREAREAQERAAARAEARAAIAEEARLARDERAEREAREAQERAAARAEARAAIAEEARLAREERAGREAREAQERAAARAEARDADQAREAREALERAEERKARSADSAAAQVAQAAELRELLTRLLAPQPGAALPAPPRHSLSAGTSPTRSPGGGVLAGAAPPAGGGGGGGGGGDSSGRASSRGSGASSPLGAGGQRRKAAAAAAEGALLAAFGAASPTAPLPGLPFAFSQLLLCGLGTAHRLCTFPAVAALLPSLADFECTVEGGVRMLLPADPATGRNGMSFFIVASKDGAVVRAAHAYRGAGAGCCYALPLARLPASLSLVVDKVQLASAQGTPVLLHASLAPRQAMSPEAFLAALGAWQGVLPCDIEGAGAQDCLCGEGREPEGAELADARERVASAAKLAALLVLPAAGAAGGSPGEL
jgi:hypothetical protein